MVSIYDHYCVCVSVLTQQVPGSQVRHMEQDSQRPVLLRLRTNNVEVRRELDMFSFAEWEQI